MATAAATAAEVQRRQALSAAVASVMGWSFDLFDLFIILYVAPTIGPLFFPSESPTLSLAAVYASFAVTLLMRPAGSAIFGTYADKHGRRLAMIVAVFGVGIVTALLGALPTIQQVGLLAPIVFLALRLVQGIFVGGVVASTHTIGTETVPPKWRGLLSGLIGGGGAGIGALVASVAFYVISSVFPGPAFAVWGWRCMFFTGILGSILSFFVFRTVEESPLWAEEQARAPHAVPKTPLKVVFSRPYLPIVLVNLLVVAGGGTQYYLTSGYLPTFLAVINKVPGPVAGQVLIVSSIVVVIAATLFGQVSELIGRRKTLLILGVMNLILIPPAYAQLAQARADAVGSIFLYAAAVSFLGNAAYAPILVFLNERFPTAIRASGTGLSWNMGFAIGGMMPTFSTALAGQVANIPLSITIFLVVAIVVYLLGAWLSPETRGQFA